MLPQQKRLVLSDYQDLYALVVPSNHLLRKINELIDFSFVYKELRNKYCCNNGRTAEDPIRMFKYLVLKTIYKLSDVDVVEHSRYDMSFKYFLGMAPEDDVINPSSLTKFRKLRLKDKELLNLLISKTVSLAIEKGIIKSNGIIIDSTHTESKYTPLQPTDVLRIRSSMLCKAVRDVDENFSFPTVNGDGNLAHELEYCRHLSALVQSDEVLSSYPLVKEKLNYLLEAMEDARDHYTLSHDRDARLGHKTTTKRFFGYKTHLAISQERIITAAIVTSGEKDDGKQMPQLLEESIRNGMKVETIIGDKAYCSRPNLKICNKENIKLIAQLHPNVMGTHNVNDGFTFNKDAGMYVCPAGHLSYQRAKHGKKEKNSNQYYAYYFDVEKCKTCSRREGCYKEGYKTKSYNMSIKTSEQEQQIRFQ